MRRHKMKRSGLAAGRLQHGADTRGHFAVFEKAVHNDGRLAGAGLLGEVAELVEAAPGRDDAPVGVDKGKGLGGVLHVGTSR